MHGSQTIWCEEIKRKFPKFFQSTRVFEVGSLDVNGSIRNLFENARYTGIDVIPGAGVDIVCVAHEFESKHKFDVVCSTSSLEHDMFWFLTLPKMMKLLDRSSLMFFSCSYRHRQHGTILRKPKDSGTAKLKGNWSQYYRNLRVIDVHSVINPERHFSSFMIGMGNKDLRFWGIKK